MKLINTISIVHEEYKRNERRMVMMLFMQIEEFAAGATAALDNLC